MALDESMDPFDVIGRTFKQECPANTDVLRCACDAILETSLSDPETVRFVERLTAAAACTRVEKYAAMMNDVAEVLRNR